MVHNSHRHGFNHPAGSEVCRTAHSLPIAPKSTVVQKPLLIPCLSVNSSVFICLSVYLTEVILEKKCVGDNRNVIAYFFPNDPDNKKPFTGYLGRSTVNYYFQRCNAEGSDIPHNIPPNCYDAISRDKRGWHTKQILTWDKNIIPSRHDLASNYMIVCQSELSIYVNV